MRNEKQDRRKKVGKNWVKLKVESYCEIDKKISINLITKT